MVRVARTVADHADPALRGGAVAEPDRGQARHLPDARLPPALPGSRAPAWPHERLSGGARDPWLRRAAQPATGRAAVSVRLHRRTVLSGGVLPLRRRTASAGQDRLARRTPCRAAPAVPGLGPVRRGSVRTGVGAVA